MKIFLISISAISIVLALLFMWWRDFNTAFIIAIVGIVAWFWNYRMDMKKIALAADAERERQAEQNEEE